MTARISAVLWTRADKLLDPLGSSQDVDKLGLCVELLKVGRGLWIRLATFGVKDTFEDSTHRHPKDDIGKRHTIGLNERLRVTAEMTLQPAPGLLQVGQVARERLSTIYRC